METYLNNRVFADTTIGRVAEAAACANKFKKAGVDITLTVTPCWCYGSETMDVDPMTIKGVWGFNGVRLHEKIFDPRMLYLCDKAGYMVWGEFPSWGVDFSNMSHAGQFLSEWQEAMARDFNHPCIITWCPLNEVWGDWEDPRIFRDSDFVDAIYDFTKRYDPTRPCVDASGGHHGTKTDLFDLIRRSAFLWSMPFITRIPL